MAKIILIFSCVPLCGNEKNVSDSFSNYPVFERVKLLLNFLFSRAYFFMESLLLFFNGPFLASAVLP